MPYLLESFVGNGEEGEHNAEHNVDGIVRVRNENTNDHDDAEDSEAQFDKERSKHGVLLLFRQSGHDNTAKNHVSNVAGKDGIACRFVMDATPNPAAPFRKMGIGHDGAQGSRWVGQNGNHLQDGFAHQQKRLCPRHFPKQPIIPIHHQAHKRCQ